jgi:hypothetical protein
MQDKRIIISRLSPNQKLSDEQVAALMQVLEKTEKQALSRGAFQSGLTGLLRRGPFQCGLTGGD